MKATIETDRRSKLISWGGAMMVMIIAILAVNLLPDRDQVTRAPQSKSISKQRPKDRHKNQRVLPEQLVEARIQSAEVVVTRELKKRLELFEKIDVELITPLEKRLDVIKNRALRAGGSPDDNDISEVRKIINQPPPALGDQVTVKDLYEQLAAFEKRILQNHLANLAAKSALQKGFSFPETLKQMQQGYTHMPSYPDLVDLVRKQHDLEGGILPPAGHRTTNDINRYRELLNQATRQSGLAESRLLGLVSQAGRKPPPITPAQKGRSMADGGGGVAIQGEEMRDVLYQLHQPKFESEELVAAQALPGRRFKRDSKRRGWLYVNTWYMVGPWDSHGRNDFSITHPPELGIDFDAVYHDGQIGKGIAETDSHWARIVGDEVNLTGTLKWKFMQSESMHNVMPVTTGRSTCYAYTELLFEDAEVMLVAIGTDDSGKLWINDREIWHDEGASWYHIDEHLEPITFQKGWNRILVRIDNNGGGPSGFSFLICPKDATIRDGAKAR